MLAEALAKAGIRVLGDLPPDGKQFWAGRFWDREEAERHPVLGEHYLREKDDLVRLVEQHAADAASVLEICCGTGAFIPVVLKHTAAVRYVGVDISVHALAEAAKRVEREGLTDRPHEGLRLVHGDVWDDGLALDPADLVLCVDSLQHLGNTDAVLARLRSFLAPGGVVIGNVWTLDHYHELERLRYGALAHLRRSASFLSSAVLIRASGGRLRSDNYRTKLARTDQLEATLRRTFGQVLQVTHHRYHTAFACRA